MLPEHIEVLSEAFRSARPIASERAPRAEPLACPVCSQTMVTETHQGVQLDVCSAHGSWFDLGEVSSMIRRIRAGERVSRSRAVSEARREGKVGGILFGAFSLLFDDE